MLLDKINAVCGFSIRMELLRAVRVDNLTGREKDLTAPEANLWVRVCDELRANTTQ